MRRRPFFGVPIAKGNVLQRDGRTVRILDFKMRTNLIVRRTRRVAVGRFVEQLQITGTQTHRNHLAESVRTAVAVSDRQRDGVAAFVRVKVSGRHARCGISVAKIPSVSQRVTVRVNGGRGVESDIQRRLTKNRGGGKLGGRWRIRDRNNDARGVRTTVAVIDGQRGGVSADSRVGVGVRGHCARIAVAEVPKISQRVAVRVSGISAVESHRQRYTAARRVGKQYGSRRLRGRVDDGNRHGFRVGAAVAVVDC